MKVTYGCFNVGQNYSLDTGDPIIPETAEYFPYEKSVGTGIYLRYDSVDNVYVFLSKEYDGELQLRYTMGRNYPNLYPIKEPNFDKIFDYLKQIENFTKKIREELL